MDDTANPAPGKFFRHCAIPGWLGTNPANDLLTYAVTHPDLFEEAGVGYGKSVIDHAIRISRRTRELGPYEEILRLRALDIKPALEKGLGIAGFEAKEVEMEFVAHGDGAHFKTHVDIATGKSQPGKKRLITMVYYLFRQPKAFSGGELRLYSLQGKEYRDIVPEHDLLVAFPAFAPHSVEPVSCPSGDFADSRFAVNIWIHG